MTRRPPHRSTARLLPLLLLAVGCGGNPTPEPGPAGPAIRVPSDFPPLPAPEDNLPTPERVALGRRLFYDERLSRTEEVSCASCHQQARAFADPDPVSTGVLERTGTRNASALVNLAWNTSFFWHGGAPSLELQAIEPIKNSLEMDMTLAEVAERLAADGELASAFETAYAAPPSEYTIPRALASFVRSLVSGDSAFDRYRRGDRRAMSAAAERGQALFEGESAECFHCHVGFNFTNNGFRNNGIEPDDPDVGRAELTLKPSDEGKFKVPTLRNVAVSAPYMHGGSLATLEEVIDQYARGGRGHANTDPTILPLELTAEEKSDLLEFLRALTDTEFLENPDHADPELNEVER